VSQQNVDVVREAFASVAPLADYKRLAPDAEFDFTAVYLDQPLLRGVEELRAFRDTGPWGRSMHFTAERYFDVDEARVLVFVRATASGQQSGTPVETAFAHEFTLRDGMIVRVKAHPNRSDALKAVGLEE
jgi:ketosteroid isomerase-like protein